MSFLFQTECSQVPVTPYNYLCQVSSSVLSKCARDVLSNSPWTRTLAQVETVSLRLSVINYLT